jgi:mono/diheme cytochrome c family protein
VGEHPVGLRGDRTRRADVNTSAFLLVLILGGAVGLGAGQPDATSRSVWQGVYAIAQSERGRSVYTQSCGQCHGETLGGDIGPTLVGPFWAIWEGRTAAELYTSIRTTMPADAPESLKAQEYVDLIAYLFSVNKFPAGEKELPTDQEELEKIRISKQ